MDRIITVYAQAEMSVSPDTITIRFSVAENGDDYSSALENTRKLSAELTEAVTETGIDKQRIRTDDFNVRKIERFERAVNGSLTAVDAGYSCSQIIEIESDCDKTILDSILKLLNKKVPGFNPQISFSIKNKSAYETELFRKVTEDAMIKAKAFCEPAGASIGKLISVDSNNSVGDMWNFPVMKGTTTINPYPVQGYSVPLTMAQETSLEDGSSSFSEDLMPKKKTIREQAVFQWEIVDK